MQNSSYTQILHESQVFICKALKGEAIVELCLALNNAADGSLRLADRVKINEINGFYPFYFFFNFSFINFHAKFE